MRTKSFKTYINENKEFNNKSLDVLRMYANDRINDTLDKFPTESQYAKLIHDDILKWVDELKWNLAGIYRRDVLNMEPTKSISRDSDDFVFPKSHRAGKGGLEKYLRLSLKSLLKTDLGMNKLHVYPREYATANKVNTRKDIPVYVSTGILELLDKKLAKDPETSKEDLVYYLLKQPTTAYRNATKEHVVPADAVLENIIDRIPADLYDSILKSIRDNNGKVDSKFMNRIEVSIREALSANYRRILRLVLSPVVFVTKKEDNSLKGKFKIGNSSIDINKQTPNLRRPFQRYKLANIAVYRASDGGKVDYNSTWSTHFRELSKYPKYSPLIRVYAKSLKEDIDMYIDSDIINESVYYEREAREIIRAIT